MLLYPSIFLLLEWIQRQWQCLCYVCFLLMLCFMSSFIFYHTFSSNGIRETQQLSYKVVSEPGCWKNRKSQSKQRKIQSASLSSANVKWPPFINLIIPLESFRRDKENNIKYDKNDACTLPHVLPEESGAIHAFPRVARAAGGWRRRAEPCSRADKPSRTEPLTVSWAVYREAPSH